MMSLISLNVYFSEKSSHFSLVRACQPLSFPSFPHNFAIGYLITNSCKPVKKPHHARESSEIKIFLVLFLWSIDRRYWLSELWMRLELCKYVMWTRWSLSRLAKYRGMCFDVSELGRFVGENLISEGAFVVDLQWFSLFVLWYCSAWLKYL